MNLKKYLEEKRMTYREFAEKLGIRPQYLQSIAYGKKKPSLELAVKIQELTGGKLTPKDLLEHYNNPQKVASKRKYRGKEVS
jgi:transcriptional regulator with XRE-family HTH domain